ncbi:hypothetical protein RND81_03G070300 [Saponaria officinalis]|uniref:Transcriptional corepressor SEUSS n=1 Tax=Saponaria officinalis TaxID=3572 RepID=A0AAW1M403_SAPOF
MGPSGEPTPIGGGPSLRSNSGMIGGQGGPMPSQVGFPSLNSSRTQFDDVNLLGNVPNVSSLLNHSHSFGNGNLSPGPRNFGNGPRSGVDGGGIQNLGNGPNGMGFDPSTSGQGQGQGQQFPNCTIESGNFQHHQQQPSQSIRGGLGGGSPVKLESRGTGEQNGALQHHGIGQVKLEPQQLQNVQGIGPVKMEAQHSGPSLFMQQQQQQQQHQLMQQMSLSRQSSQVAQMSLLQQQRMLHLQQQQQQQLLKSTPQQRSQIQQSQFSPQNLPVRAPVKSVYEPGMCARRLTHYMYQQRRRPEDNSIEFWRNFVTEYFAPNAKKKWCVSMYGSGRQTAGVFPQDVWHCEICKRKPGRGFEATAEVLPRLFKIKYESGTLEELLYIDMPREYQNSAGQIVLDYAKAIQESVFEQLRVVRDGQLRIVFSPDLKICSWEFCARRHEELIPRRLLIPQVSQLGTVAQKYQAAIQNSSSSISVSDLQSNCNMFVASARQLAKTLEVPLVNDLGYTKRYVRCLQISEVVNSMKDLIDYSRSTGSGPMESLTKFPRRTSMPSALQGQNRQPDEQQQQQQQRSMVQDSNNNDHSSTQAGAMQVSSTNGVASVNNTLNMSSSSTSHSTISGLLHQNSMNNSNSRYGGTSSIQNPSPFQSPAPSSSNNPAMSNIDGDTNDTQSSVQKFIQDMMLNKMANGVLPSGNSNVNVPEFDVGNGPTSSNSSMGGGPFGGIGGGIGRAYMVNGIRGAVGNNSMNGRVGINRHEQYNLGDQMLSGLGSVNGFNNHQFDWKPSP